MKFELTTQLFSEIDTLLATYVSDVSTQLIATATPFVTAALTISFLMYSVLIVRGAVQMPIMDFLGKSMRVAIIASIALVGGLYQAEWSKIILALPDSLSASLLATAHGETGVGKLDAIFSKGFNVATDLFSKVSVRSLGSSLVYVLAAGIVLLFTIAFGGLGIAVLMVCKVAVALMVALGPIFIMALLFDATRSFFERWVGQLVNYTILTILFVLVFALIMSIYGNYVGKMTFDGTQNIGWTLGGLGLICGSALFLLLQLPAIAGALSGGVSISFVAPIMATTGLAMGASRLAGAAGKIASRR